MSNRPFIGARLEEKFLIRLNAGLRRNGWTESVIPYTGFGTTEHIRILARVVLRPPAAETQLGQVTAHFLNQRGWRNFFGAPVPRAEVTVEVNDRRIQLQTDQAGYLDVRVKSHDLEPGWREVTITTSASQAERAPVQVIAATQTFGLVSDIDDTVISTFLPRLFIAAWNTLVVTEQAREAVPGMARMYRRLLAANPGAPIIYVSTGAWNTFDFLNRFLARHGFPRGAMLLTDWGPTNTGWFRSGPEHKRTALRELARDFPQIRWVLVGDNGQHDPFLYTEFAELQPDHVRAIAIRELSPAEQVLAHGYPTTVLTDDHHVHWTPDLAPIVRGSDGDALAPQLNGVLEETE